MVLATPTVAIAQEAVETESSGFLAGLDAVFSQIVNVLAQVFFFEIFGLPFIVLWLILGAIFFTLRMGFINRLLAEVGNRERGKGNSRKEWRQKVL